MRRYMLVVKATPEFEAGSFPDQAFEAEAARYLSELAQAGALVACDRLQPSSQGKRVHYKAGQFTVTDGPFAETKELVAGYCLIRAASLEEAVAWARRMPFRSGDVDVRPLFELSDFPVDPAEQLGGWRDREAAHTNPTRKRGRQGNAVTPSLARRVSVPPKRQTELPPPPLKVDRRGPSPIGSAGGPSTHASGQPRARLTYIPPARQPGTTRYLGLLKADRDTEAGVMPGEKALAAMGAFIDEASKSGILLSGEGLQPSSQSARVRFSGSQRLVTDGPFTETKELVAGYAILQFATPAEALAWTKRFVQVDAPGRLNEECECELRPIVD